jgi:hypothetical protein
VEDHLEVEAHLQEAEPEEEEAVVEEEEEDLVEMQRYALLTLYRGMECK